MSKSEFKGPTEYDTYANCLGKALCYVPTPATVGLYAPWGCGINRLLHKIQKQMTIEALHREKKELARTQEKPRPATGLGFVLLLLHLVFHNPQLTERHQNRKNIRFIFIQFSAWQFAGSEKLWAGLITTLCEGIKNHFGNVPTSIVRALGHQADIEPSNSSHEWESKKFLGIPIWLIFTLLLLLVVALTLAITTFGFSIGEMGTDYIVGLEGVGIGLVGFSALITMKNSIMVGKNIFVSQKDKMESLMNKTDFSTQLGFMNDVKKEVKVLTNFIHYMEVFERRKIRIVLEIMNLDRCMPDKVVGVLDAMNILLSDQDAPFISLLAVDPSIIVACVEKSSSLKGVADNGYEFLNRIVTLPFSVPKMDTQTKLNFLQQVVEGKSALMEESPQQSERFEANKFQENSLESIPLITVSSDYSRPSMQKNKETKPADQIRQAYQCLTDRDNNLHEYIEENFLQMRRIINTIPVTMRLMLERNISMSSFPPQRIAAWVILANGWPCRLSWIWQCLEDAEQRKELGEEKEINDEMLLWTIYENSSDGLKLIQSSIDKLLALDGDPEIFQKFLSTYKFTVKDAKTILPFTINLDYSLKRKMELLLGSKLLGTRGDASLSPTTATSFE